MLSRGENVPKALSRGEIVLKMLPRREIVPKTLSKGENVPKIISRGRICQICLRIPWEGDYAKQALGLDLEDGVHLLKLAYFAFYQTQGAYKSNNPKKINMR